MLADSYLNIANFIPHKNLKASFFLAHVPLWSLVLSLAISNYKYWILHILATSVNLTELLLFQHAAPN